VQELPIRTLKKRKALDAESLGSAVRTPPVIYSTPPDLWLAKARDPEGESDSYPLLRAPRGGFIASMLFTRSPLSSHPIGLTWAASSYFGRAR